MFFAGEDLFFVKYIRRLADGQGCTRSSPIAVCAPTAYTKSPSATRLLLGFSFNNNTNKNTHYLTANTLSLSASDPPLAAI